MAMRDSKSGGVRLRQLVAGFAIVIVVSPDASAQTLFERRDSTRPVPSRPFRVNFDSQATARPVQADLSGWSTLSNADVSGIQFRPPRRRYPGTSSSATKSAQKLTAAIALGLVGGLAGGLIGGTLNNNCTCDSPGMTGFVIGAPIGAAVGAVAGYLLVK
jgi:uncharacterized membrane protein YeaQ/YmgE (transglycosylase-associated protein family)